MLRASLKSGAFLMKPMMGREAFPKLFRGVKFAEPQKQNKYSRIITRLTFISRYPNEGKWLNQIRYHYQD